MAGIITIHVTPDFVLPKSLPFCQSASTYVIPTRSLPCHHPTSTKPQTSSVPLPDLHAIPVAVSSPEFHIIQDAVPSPTFTSSHHSISLSSPESVSIIYVITQLHVTPYFFYVFTRLPYHSMYLWWRHTTSI